MTQCRAGGFRKPHIPAATTLPEPKVGASGITSERAVN